MNDNDYKEALFYAASIFNERLGAEFSEDNLVLRCFQTENQQEVFEQFCKQYFPDRLEDRYKEKESGDEVECYSPFELGASNIDWLSGMYEAVWQQLEESKKVEPQAEEQ